MSTIKTYSGLKSRIKSWLIRPDLEVELPTFIELAEAELNRRLRTRQMVKRSRVMADSRYIELPGDWRKAWNIQRVEDEFPLTYMTPVELDKVRHEAKRNPAASVNQCHRAATYYTLFGDSLELGPSPTPEAPVEVEMLYYATIPPLSEDDPTNWLLSMHPDLYLFGALKHTATFLKEDERLQVWSSQFEAALASANQEDTSARRSGAPMQRSVRGFQ